MYIVILDDIADLLRAIPIKVKDDSDCQIER